LDVSFHSSSILSIFGIFEKFYQQVWLMTKGKRNNTQFNLPVAVPMVVEKVIAYV